MLVVPGTAATLALIGLLVYYGAANADSPNSVMSFLVEAGGALLLYAVVMVAITPMGHAEGQGIHYIVARTDVEDDRIRQGQRLEREAERAREAATRSRPE